MVLVQVAFATSTVLPTAGSLPVLGRLALAASPDDVIDLLVGFALVSSQPLTIWMRSRFAPIGSFSAATRNVG